MTQRPYTAPVLVNAWFREAFDRIAQHTATAHTSVPGIAYQDLHQQLWELYKGGRVLKRKTSTISAKPRAVVHRDIDELIMLTYDTCPIKLGVDEKGNLFLRAVDRYDRAEAERRIEPTQKGSLRAVGELSPYDIDWFTPHTLAAYEDAVYRTHLLQRPNPVRRLGVLARTLRLDRELSILIGRRARHFDKEAPFDDFQKVELINRLDVRQLLAIETERAREEAKKLLRKVHLPEWLADRW